MSALQSRATPQQGNSEIVEFITQAEHARRCGVSRKSVTKWKASGQLVMVGNLVDPARSYKGDRYHFSAKAVRLSQRAPKASSVLTLARTEWLARLKALDWSYTPDWSDDAQRLRIHAAATAMGLLAVLDDAPDGIGRHGGWQLRSLALLRDYRGPCTDAVVAGHGFELDEHEVLQECRECIAHPDDQPADLEEPMTMDPAALVLMAYPFSSWHRRPGLP